MDAAKRPNYGTPNRTTHPALAAAAPFAVDVAVYHKLRAVILDGPQLYKGTITDG